jgi:cytidylate kinase
MKISEITVNEGINDKYIGKCVFTAGAPASGKTTISRKLFSHLGFREVNIDKLLEFFAEIKGLDLKNMHTWDQAIFDRSEDLTFSSMEMFIKGRLPLLIDGTGRNYKKITQLATRLKEDYGYDAGLLFVNTSLQVSISRNAERKRSLTDMQYIKNAWKDSQSNLGIYQNFFGNNLFIVDNNSRSEADLTSVSKRIDKFIDTPTKNLKFNQWMQDEKKKRNITEAFEDDGNNLLKIREFIEKNCQPYLKEIGGIEELPFTLMHGSNSSALKQNIATIITIIQERKPKDTPLYIHDQLNAGLMKAGFKAHRGNSIFASGHNGVSGSYGQTYIVIPIGEYHYTWGLAKYGPIRDLWDLQPYIDMANQGYMSIDDDEMQEGANIDDDEMGQFRGDTGKFIKQIMDEIDTLKNYQLHFHDLEDYFKKYYKVDNLEAAIRSGAEVYLHAQKVVMLNDAYVDDLLNAEAPKARPRPGKA